MIKAVAPGGVGEVGTENEGAVSEVPAYLSLYDSRGWRLPSMAKRAVTVPLDFFLISI